MGSKKNSRKSADLLLLPAHSNMTVEGTLNYAKLENPEEIIIVSYREDEGVTTLGSRMSNESALWLLECAKIQLMRST